MNYRLFGNRLRTLRINSNLTQENIADALEITQSAYSKIERGERKLSMQHLKKMCVLFNLELEHITAYCQGYTTLSEIIQLMEAKYPHHKKVTQAA